MPNEPNESKKKSGSKGGMGFAAGVLALVALLGIGGLFVVYSGAFNVAATEEHTSFFRWALDTTFHNSVKRRADSVKPPGSITPEMAEQGASAYKAMCEHCHAGPGVERAEWASGMRPQPPHLNEAANKWAPEELFWIVKHGMKMTGMPAFGPTHNNQDLWNVVAFVKQLPGMTAETYAARGGDGGRSEGGETQGSGDTAH